MASKSETVDDIIAINRAMYQGCEECSLSDKDVKWFLDLLDSIETAYHREVTELRECLKEATGCADEFQKFFETHPYLCKYTRDVIKKSKKALEGAKDDSPSCEDN